MFSTMSRHISVFAIFFGLSACEGGDQATSRACVPGQSVECHGPNGCEGYQTCRADGASYDECVCGSGGSSGQAGGAGFAGAGAGGASGASGTGDDGGMDAADADSGGGKPVQTWVRTVGTDTDSPHLGAMAAMSDGTLLALLADDFHDPFFRFAALDENGEVVWQKALPGGSATTVFRDRASDRVVLAGNLVNGAWLAAVGPDGEVGNQEILTTSGGLFPRVEAGATTTDGGVVLVGSVETGYTTNPDQVDGLVVRVDSAWNLQWALGLTNNSWNKVRVKDVTTLPTGESAVASFGWNDDFKSSTWGVTLLDAAGAVMWSRSLNPDQLGDVLSKMWVRAADDGSIYFAGTNEIGFHHREAIIVKLDPSGLMGWQKRASVTSNSTDDQCVEVVGLELVGGMTPVVLLSTDSFGTNPEETGLLHLDGAGAIVAQRRYRNGPPGLAKGLAPWSNGAWAIAFGYSGVLHNESLARVDPLGALDGTCPPELGAPADYTLSDVLVNLATGPTAISVPSIDVTVTQTALLAQTADAFPVQCTGP